MTQKLRPIRFSQHFGLDKSQWELDFVDIPLNTDIPLFVDPYAISIEEDEWSKECNDMIITYFDMLIKAIREKDNKLISRLLLNLHEPNDTHLGLSKTASKGRGIGKVQAKQLLDSFKNSEAVKSGFLYDITEAALMIEGIGADKISDITTNIIKGKLIEYTQSQCRLFNIPTRKVATGVLFDFSIMNWRDKYEELPIYEGNRIVLIPKIIVRKNPEINAEGFYSFILDYLQQEHTKPGDGLANLLKNGKLKVYKKDLRKKYPFSRQFIYEYARKNPKVMLEYRSEVRRTSKSMSDRQIEYRQQEFVDVDCDYLIEKLNKIDTGTESAEKYHEFILGALGVIFRDRIRRPRKEQEINEGRKRIDILFDNAKKGFFQNLNILHKIKCPYIIIECKNYTKDIKNPELDQILGRFSDKKGKFGIITCRQIENQELIIKKQRDVVNNQSCFILVLSDEDIIELLKLRKENKEQEIDDYMEDKLKEIIL